MRPVRLLLHLAISFQIINFNHWEEDIQANQVTEDGEKTQL